VADGDIKIAQEAVFNTVNPTVDGELLATLPGRVRNGGLADVDDLLDDIQFAEAVGALGVITGTVERGTVLLANVFDVPQPVVGETEPMAALDGANTSAAVVATHNDVFDLQNIDGELQDGEAIEVAVRNDVGEVTMNEHVARQEPDDLIGGDAAVGTADPKIGGRLLAGEFPKKPGVGPADAFGPGAVISEQLFQSTHVVR